MANGGERLEAFVADIEALLLGEGFVVTTRARVFDDSGVQTAEIDVEVEGQVGTSSIRWVFECRDRPSGGAEDVAWIEQLVGRRERLRADRMFAVSATGFSPAARKFATEKGIVLRTVSSIEDLAKDFKVERLVFINSRVSSIQSIDVRTADPTDKRQLSIGSDEVAMRRSSSSGSWVTLSDVLRDAAPREAEGDPKAQIYPRVQKRIYLTKEPMELRINGEIVSINRLRVAYELTTEKLDSRAVAARIYAEGDREIGREGDFEFQLGERQVRVRVQLLANDDGTERLRVVSEPDDGVRLQRLVIYGRRSAAED